MKYNRRVFLYVLVFFCTLYGCKKEAYIASSRVTRARMPWGGNLTWVGRRECGFYGTNDAFYLAPISVIDSTLVQIGLDNYIFCCNQGALQKYAHKNHTHPSFIDDSLIYNFQDHSVCLWYTYIESHGGEAIDVKTLSFSDYSIVRHYAHQLSGTKLMSGMELDTVFAVGPVSDTAFAIDTSITFSLINDTTLTINYAPLNVGDSVLHLRSFDSSTITFTCYTHGCDFYRRMSVVYDYVHNTFNLSAYNYLDQTWYHVFLH